MEAATAECVRVVVRCRPLNKLETSDGRRPIVGVDTELQQAGSSGCCSRLGVLAFAQRTSSSSSTVLIYIKLTLSVSAGCSSAHWRVWRAAKDLHL